MKTNLSLVFLAFLIVISCQKQEDIDSSFERVRIDLQHDIVDTISIFDLCSSINLICLQENDSIKINAGGTKCVVDQGYMYFLEPTSQNLFQFDTTGAYIKTIARRGRGHGEYTMAEDLLINPINNLIEVLNPIGKIMRYSVDGENTFVSEVDFTKRISSVNEFALIESGKYFLYSLAENKYYTYDEYSDKLSCLGSILPDWIVTTIYGNGKMFQHNNEIRVFSKIDGLYYTFSNKSNELIGYLDFDLGKNERSHSSIAPNKDISYYHRLALLSPRTIRFCNATAETDKSIIATITYKGITNFHTIIYDKESKTYKIFGKTVENVNFFPYAVCGEDVYYLIEDSRLFSRVVPSDCIPANNFSTDNNYIIVYKDLKI